MKKRKNIILGILSSCLVVCLVSGNALASNSNTSINTASSTGQTGVISDLSSRYFYENYYDQTYDLSYCDWAR